MLLNDRQIRDQIGMITPFVPEQVREINGNRIVSYGLSSFGYDIRLDRFYRRDPLHGRVVSPGQVIDWYEWSSDGAIIYPGQTVLGQSFETFSIPEDVIAVSQGKSTYARIGLLVNCSPMEPGWKGIYTMSLSNTSQNPIRVWSNQGIAQMMFFKGELPDVTYASRNGKYQNAVGITPSRL